MRTGAAPAEFDLSGAAPVQSLKPMLPFTRQERLALIFLIAVIFTGFLLQLIFKKNPEWRERTNILEGIKSEN